MRDLTLFLLLASASYLGAQTTPINLYAHFLGDWAGTDRYAKSGTFITKPLSVHITQLPKDRGMLLEYTYGDGNKGKIERLTRVITLDPTHHKVTSQAHVLGKLTYDTVGLDEFGKDGFGSFEVRNTVLERGVVVMYVGTYELRQNELSWVWQRAEQGQPLTPYGEFHLKRVPDGANTSNGIP